MGTHWRCSVQQPFIDWLILERGQNIAVKEKHGLVTPYTSHMHPNRGREPAACICALTENWIHQPLGIWDDAPANWATLAKAVQQPFKTWDLVFKKEIAFQLDLKGYGRFWSSWDKRGSFPAAENNEYIREDEEEWDTSAEQQYSILARTIKDS